MIAARSGAETSVTVRSRCAARERPQVGAALDRRRGRQHADPARVGDRRGDLGLGLDHRDHLDPALAGHLARGLEPGAGGRVAGDHDQLRPPVEQEAGVALDALAQLVRCLRPVGKARVVAEVDVVLLGQRDQELVQHGEPADPGVEDGDRQRGIGRARRSSVPRSSRRPRGCETSLVVGAKTTRSTLSLWSEDSFLSIASKGSAALDRLDRLGALDRVRSARPRRRSRSPRSASIGSALSALLALVGDVVDDARSGDGRGAARRVADRRRGVRGRGDRGRPARLSAAYRNGFATIT